MVQPRPRGRWTALRNHVALRKGTPEERQARGTMNLGTIWLRTAIWSAIVVLRGSPDSSVMMVMVMAVMMDD